jgi:putative hemolysin
MAETGDVTAVRFLSPGSVLGRVMPEAAVRLVRGRGGPVDRLVPPVSLPAGEVLGRIGDLEVRLAASRREVRIAQALRFRVFFEEMSARAGVRARLTRRDADRFDAICDHLLVVDHGAEAGPIVVGTYRLLRQGVADRSGGFYTAGEFDIAPLVARHPGLSFLELGRSCVLAPWRTKRTVELLWHGIWAYVLRHKVDVMIGCASLDGTDPDRLALPLSFLHHRARADGEWYAAARPDRRVAMDRMPAEAIDDRAALTALPPLLKGYLRLGGRIGDGAVVDAGFGTTDVLVVLPVAAISPRYVAYYGPDASRHA